jgi:phosphomannomutase / phosphoglucomutase
MGDIFMKIPEHIFREYDIRGIVDKDLSAEFAYILGRSFASKVKEHGTGTVAIGRDCRISSPAYAAALAEGIASEGLKVVLTGMGPTPQLYYAIFEGNLAGGIQVTGSHNPSDMNGFKMCIGTHTLSGEEIQDLKARCLKLATASKPSVDKSLIVENDLRAKYTEMLINNSKPHMGKRKLKVVVDAGNGVGGLVGPTVLRALGAEVIELFCEPDGTFPNHHPDPTVPENLEHLIKKVKEVGADLGIGWDGDADRIGAVDEKGEIIFGDMLLLIYGRALLESIPHPTIIGDVKCSSRLFDDLNSRGAKAIMWKTGHSLIKGKLKEVSGDLAGEMSGHIFFKHRYYGFDDAMYSSSRLLEILSHTEKKCSELLGDLPPAFSTPEMRVDCPEELKFKIAEKAQSAFAEEKVITIDGVRITFADGWGLVRASNTQPVLVMRFEASSPAALERIQNQVISKIEEIKASL